MTVESTSEAHSRILRRRGSLVLALFALLWAVNGAWGISSSRGVLLPGVAAVGVVTAAVAGFGLRAAPLLAGERPRRLPSGWNRSIGLVNLGQVAAIVLSGALLGLAGVPELGPSLVCLVVGLHFVPLARLCDQPQYRWTAVFMTGVAVLGCVLLAADTSGGGTRAAVGLGAAAVLWGTSVHLGVRG